MQGTGHWSDWGETHGPAGHLGAGLKYRLFAWAKRDRRAPWFALMGSLGHDSKTRFIIADGIEYSPPRTGDLVCWANDIWFMYWNNSGEVVLTVRRLE
jgi:hypothetical protein